MSVLRQAHDGRVFFWRGVRLGLSSLVAVAMAMAVGVACGGDDGGDSGKVRVVTTLPLFADFVREVGGDRVEVTALVPAGADPHTWEPSPRDVKRVAEADIAFANGLDLEPSAIRLIEANLKDGASLVKLGEEVAGGVSTPPAPSIDPHLWLEPAIGQQYATITREKLGELDPAHEETYKSNAREYLEAIAGARDDAKRTIGSVRPEDRKLVTTHAAFGYLDSAFGIQVVATVVRNPGQEPSPEDVANVTLTIEGENVPAVFREPQLDSEGRILEQAAKDAGVQVCVLYSDSLDDRVTSYIEMIRFNAGEIARCLGGNGDG